ncbi:MAG: hypothetical protein A3D26_03975 [Candidatus Blackburnbacteria bacterium RIFCSPHIGHO2_02_FULL_44_20]|uniref:Uncharacterized protein n=1 Tax=Candidatus Blackburnbacteria bacterium RIFCSPHIGHO2_02_FULL_44_20 TaxID=1797516 RepID=A0A1G1V5T9_9BACT|nr:MAG: hypothetical protein A3E16_02395 [Candidatus Blackburnbacteria bacterium RIFCSPHIGHO2_12_FULL_44_25]OGY10612.1 MAG: hypothetical protein A3D26_03975 [Candidatus Blackburnbacteria bacterium RIFCSPHIGHO2_02_FULL_44_20]
MANTKLSPLEKAVIDVLRSAGKEGMDRLSLSSTLTNEYRRGLDLHKACYELHKNGKITWEGSKWYLSRFAPNAQGKLLERLKALGSEGMSVNDAIAYIQSVTQPALDKGRADARLRSHAGAGIVARIRDMVYHPDWVMPKPAA